MTPPSYGAYGALARRPAPGSIVDRVGNEAGWSGSIMNLGLVPVPKNAETKYQINSSWWT